MAKSVTARRHGVEHVAPRHSLTGERRSCRRRTSPHITGFLP
ncbi:hypothetical protein AKJ09_02351 [Labilithrix luteola]|uniref:Uncharacterized protein n=1 Tax=Labilithrix luteola TaxID=1391654 RepID=A0A0K1PQ85_9BACT|nr:hypothetical protein AKJ09_02351 [Labilithrix luteola]